jgi:hypothetical protein
VIPWFEIILNQGFHRFLKPEFEKTEFGSHPTNKSLEFNSLCTPDIVLFQFQIRWCNPFENLFETKRDIEIS